MVTKNNSAILIGMVAILAILLFVTPSMDLFSSSGDNVERFVPEEVEKGEEFTVTYQASSTNSKWGVSIVDTVSGGCTFPEGESEFKDVILSDSSSEIEIKVEAPVQEASCSFSGDYKFGSSSTSDMVDKSVQVVSTGDEDDCNKYYWFDSEDNESCGYKEFCGDFMYDGLRIFETKSACQDALGVDDSSDEDSDVDDDTEKEVEWWNEEILEAGDFSVKMWMILSFAGFIFLLIISGGRRR